MLPNNTLDADARKTRAAHPGRLGKAPAMRGPDKEQPKNERPVAHVWRN
jgi:hypothetical protein